MKLFARTAAGSQRVEATTLADASPGAEWVEVPEMPEKSDRDLLLVNGQLVWGDARTLEQAKTQAWARIKAARDQALLTFEALGYVFDLNEARIGGAATAALLAKQTSAPYTEVWTLADNSDVQLSADDQIAVGLAMKSHISAVWAHGRTLRAAIDAAQAPADADAVSWGTT